MPTITQDMRYRLSLLKYSEKYGVSRAAAKYHTNRQYIYRWKRRFDGSLESLRERSRRPHHHPSQHTPEELRLISNMRRRNPHEGLVIFWVKLRMRGYQRSISGLYRLLRRLQMTPVKPPNPKYVPKPYEQMSFPGQRVQIDVKFVPSVCLSNPAIKGQKFYQYTAIDECTRWRFVEAFDEHNTYSSARFLDMFLKAAPFKVKCIQTDNGTEFTKRLLKHEKDLTLFEEKLMRYGIHHKLIKPYTPRHNGKVERSHRKDNERFYATHSFYSFDDFRQQLKLYNRRDYNHFPMRPLGWRTPHQVLSSFFTSL